MQDFAISPMQYELHLNAGVPCNPSFRGPSQHILGTTPVSLSLVPQLASIPHNTNHGSCLHRFAAASTKPILDFRQAVQPSDPGLYWYIVLAELLAETGDDVRQS